MMRKIILFFGFSFLYLPLFYLIFFSFNAGHFITKWEGFSLGWYDALFRDKRLISSLFLSIKIAFSVATIASILGLLAAISLTHFRFSTKPIFRSLVLGPLMMPELIMGLALLFFFITISTYFPITRGSFTIFIAHVTLTIAYVTLIIEARLSQMDPSLIEAAQDLGASPFKAFLSITLPLILPALLIGWLLAFIVSFDEVIIASFVTGPGATTLPIAIFSMLKLGLTPKLNALASVLIASVTIVAAAIAFIGIRLKRPS